MAVWGKYERKNNMNKWTGIEKSILYELYVVQEKPMHTIASELNVSIGSVYNYLKKYGIKTRSKEATFTMKGKKLSEERCRRMSEHLKGRVISSETRKKMSESLKHGGIGHKKKRNDGYVSIYFPDHPCSSEDGYIMEHVLVMEALIGRHLYDDECVHHINEKRNDNRKENLKLMTKKEHTAFHSKKRWEEKERWNDLSIK